MATSAEKLEAIYALPEGATDAHSPNTEPVSGVQVRKPLGFNPKLNVALKAMGDTRRPITERRAEVRAFSTPEDVSPEIAATVKDNAFAAVHQVPLELKPQHTLMILAHINGCSVKQICAQTGYSEPQVRLVLNSPMGKREIARLTAEITLDVKKLTVGDVTASLDVMRSIRDNTQLPASVRLAAADKFLDRYFGKPNVQVSVESKGVEADADMGQLDAELETLRARQRDLIGRSPVRKVTVSQTTTVSVTEAQPAPAPITHGKS